MGSDNNPVSGCNCGQYPDADKYQSSYDKRIDVYIRSDIPAERRIAKFRIGIERVSRSG